MEKREVEGYPGFQPDQPLLLGLSKRKLEKVALVSNQRVPSFSKVRRSDSIRFRPMHARFTLLDRQSNKMKHLRSRAHQH